MAKEIKIKEPIPIDYSQETHVAWDPGTVPEVAAMKFPSCIQWVYDCWVSWQAQHQGSAQWKGGADEGKGSNAERFNVCPSLWRKDFFWLVSTVQTGEGHIKECVGKLGVFKSTHANGTSPRAPGVPADGVSKPLADTSEDSSHPGDTPEGGWIQTQNIALSRDEKKDAGVLMFGKKLGQIHDPFVCPPPRDNEIIKITQCRSLQ